MRMPDFFVCFSPSDIMAFGMGRCGGGEWQWLVFWWLCLGYGCQCCHYLPLLLLSRKVGGIWVIKVVVVQIPSQKRNHDVNFLRHHSFLSVGITSSFLFGWFFSLLLQLYNMQLSPSFPTKNRNHEWIHFTFFVYHPFSFLLLYPEMNVHIKCGEMDIITRMAFYLWPQFSTLLHALQHSSDLTK